MEKARPLGELLADLTTDPEARAAYRNDPEGYLSSAGYENLSTEEAGQAMTHHADRLPPELAERLAPVVMAHSPATVALPDDLPGHLDDGDDPGGDLGLSDPFGLLAELPLIDDTDVDPEDLFEDHRVPDPGTSSTADHEVDHDHPGDVGDLDDPTENDHPGDLDDLDEEPETVTGDDPTDNDHPGDLDDLDEEPETVTGDDPTDELGSHLEHSSGALDPTDDFEDQFEDPTGTVDDLNPPMDPLPESAGIEDLTEPLDDLNPPMDPLPESAGIEDLTEPLDDPALIMEDPDLDPVEPPDDLD